MKRSERIAITDRRSQALQHQVKEELLTHIRKISNDSEVLFFLDEFKKFILSPSTYIGEGEVQMRELYNSMYGKSDTSRSPAQRAMLIMVTINTQINAIREPYARAHRLRTQNEES